MCGGVGGWVGGVGVPCGDGVELVQHELSLVWVDGHDHAPCADVPPEVLEGLRGRLDLVGVEREPELTAGG